MRASFLVNRFRGDAVAAAKRTAEWLSARGILVAAEREVAGALGVPEQRPDELAEADIMVTFGGDGTVLRGAHLISQTNAPLLGVFFGSFGFVTMCQPGEVEDALQRWIDGRLQVEPRMMLRAELMRSGRTIATLHCLNEVVVQRLATTRIITFDLSVNGQRITEFPSDGVMVATPTGSTAYSLSAGGPILEPSMQAILAVCLLPHTLNARPLVLDRDAVLEIGLDSSEAVLSADGASRLHLLQGDRVRVTRSDRITRLARLSEHDFLSKLSSRFQWSSAPKAAGDD